MLIAEAEDLVPPICSSPNLSLAEQIDSPWGDAASPSLAQHTQTIARGMPNKAWRVFTWSSLARGFLAGGILHAGKFRCG